jgi:hypothetical protein
MKSSLGNTLSKISVPRPTIARFFKKRSLFVEFIPQNEERSAALRADYFDILHVAGKDSACSPLHINCARGWVHALNIVKLNEDYREC